MFVLDLDLHRDVLCNTPPVRPVHREGEEGRKKVAREVLFEPES